MGSGRILIVEDEAMVSMLIEDVVSIAGGTVTGVAESVEDGRQLIRENAFDMVFLDVNLQGETSEPLAELLRVSNIPVVVTTGSFGKTLPEAYQGFDVVQKPFSVPTLLDLIQKHAF